LREKNSIVFQKITRNEINYVEITLLLYISIKKKLNWLHVKNQTIFLFSQIPQKIKTNTSKKTWFLLFLQNHKKWSVIHGKDSILIDFHKNTKIELKCNTWKNDKFRFFSKAKKIEVFYMEKTKLVFSFINLKKWSEIRGNNSVVIDFHKNKNIIELWYNTWKNKISYCFLQTQEFKSTSRKKNCTDFHKIKKHEIKYIEKTLLLYIFTKTQKSK